MQAWEQLIEQWPQLIFLSPKFEFLIFLVSNFKYRVYDTGNTLKKFGVFYWASRIYLWSSSKLAYDFNGSLLLYICPKQPGSYGTHSLSLFCFVFQWHLFETTASLWLRLWLEELEDKILWFWWNIWWRSCCYISKMYCFTACFKS